MGGTAGAVRGRQATTRATDATVDAGVDGFVSATSSGDMAGGLPKHEGPTRNGAGRHSACARDGLTLDWCVQEISMLVRSGSAQGSGRIPSP